MDISIKICLGTLIGCLIGCSSMPMPNPAARAQVLQTQVADLDRELRVINNSTGPDQQADMHLYWGMLQKQLSYVHDMPGVVSRGCNDWTLLDPSVTGRGTFFSNRPCPTLHVGAPAAGFPFPDRLTPQLFALIMTQQLAVLQAQVDDIEAEPNAAARADLIREHYDTRYRDMQTVLGRDWMWTPHDASTLPEASTMGAQLLQNYCSQCHAAPPPSLKTPAEWDYIALRMEEIIRTEAATPASGIRMPSSDEMRLIAFYLESNGRQ